VTFHRPGPNNTIVVIANIQQKPLLSPSDPSFAVFRNINNFGNGTQKLVVRKSYMEPAHRLPDGHMSKPLKNWIDAYEITFQVSVPQIVINN
jgi:hypothetical protein